MTRTDWAPAAAPKSATACATIPDYDRDRLQLHQPRGRRSGPPARRRPQGRRAPPSCAGRSARPRPRPRPARSPTTSPSKATCRASGLTSAADQLALCKYSAGVRGCKTPGTASRESTDGRPDLARTAWPRSRRPTGMRWPAPNRPTARPSTPSPPTAFCWRWRHRARPARAPAGRPGPLVLRDGGAGLAAMPLYVKSHSQGEYIFDHGWAEAL